MPPTLPAAPVDFTAQGIQIHIGGSLVSASAAVGIDVRALVEDAIDRIQSALNVPPTTVSVHAEDVPDYAGGVTGVAYPSGDLVVKVDLDSPNGLRDALERRVATTLAHEMHHSKRSQARVGEPPTLREAIVTEGLAVAFEDELYPGNSSWFKSLPGDAERQAWARAQSELDVIQTDHRFDAVWFRAAGDLPRWTGYVIGYHIVKSYEQRHPGSSAASLVTTDAATITSESGYQGAAP